MIKRLFRNIIFSFPLQLIMVLIKKHLLLIFLWISLFGYVGQIFGGHYGIPYLYLDPEYNGNVDFYSFFLIGIAIGGFIMAWHIMFYMLNSYRFHFLASLTRPFTTFCFNNSVIPGAFIVFYSYKIIQFREARGELLYPDIFMKLLGLWGGILLMILVITIYFILFNTNVSRFLEKLTDKAREGYLNKQVKLNKLKADMLVDRYQWPVETYFANPITIRLARDVSHYDPRLVLRILRQNHKNGFVIVFMSILTLVLLSNTIDIPEFRIPAAASITIFFVILIVVGGALSYWLKGWSAILVIVSLLLANHFVDHQKYLRKNQLFGIKYHNVERAPYTDRAIDSLSSDFLIEKDIESTTKILKQWRYKLVRDYGDETPPIIFINVSGGGSKSSYWTMAVLQELQKEFGDKFMRHTILMSGASGGMLGSAYFRELYYQHVRGEFVDITNQIFLEDMGKDLLNAVTYSIVANDLFFPFKKYYYQGEAYNKDRGYLFERQFNENTNFQLDKPVIDYKSAEANGNIPMLILSPTIVNDQRMLLISAQDISYMARPHLRNELNISGNLEPDGIELMRWMENNGSENVKMVSALRMNASFPYILPAVNLPSEPVTKIMDAGIRDNYGLSVSTRFYSSFKNWIDINCGEAIFLQIRTDNLESELEQANKSSFLGELTKPIGNIYSNFLFVQGYTGNQYLECLDHGLANIHKLTFTYIPSLRNKEASMSLHLTEQEKEDIRESFFLDLNQEPLERLKDILK
ncbi:MAG: hypothetical protein R2753_13880 [Chitinophagales bacterium]